MYRARRRRSAAIRCTLSLVAAAFPGNNHAHTSTRQLYADALAGPLPASRGVKLALNKLRGIAAAPVQPAHVSMQDE